MATGPKRRQSGHERSVIRKLAAMTWRQRDAYYSQMSRKDVNSAISEIVGRHVPPAKGRRRHDL
ncbi:MAG: hypothetical protein OXH86_06940 [Acidimicrobiaceae bacterium]|nr:hypothetical protein [Acidimicrobiaceae bacterium]MDE0497070.1 hypothetical protein [Acidimicrobiaceae bacterium]